ncbi:MAG: DUF1588 domain-containing protein [Akkermansiaceae bacterium]|nr:DUF1588 domain-containing protein [Akkermansiaceae bacterium]
MFLNLNRYHHAPWAAVALFAIGSWLGAEPAKEGEAQIGQDPAKLQAQALELIDHYCISCHGPDKQEGKIRFDALETIDTVDLQTLFEDAQDALHFEEMPPEEAKKQPTDAERAILLAWFKDQLGGEAAAKLEEKMRRPESGNYVDHEDLFSGKYADLPGYTEDRRWLISEHIFKEKFNRILNRKATRKIDGKAVGVSGDSNLRGVNLTNPFQLSNDAGIRYYANETLNGGHLLTMMANSREATSTMLATAKRDGRYLPAAHEILAEETKKQETLAQRKNFLDAHVEQVLKDTFGDQHEKMLPRFIRLEIPNTSTTGETKKAGIDSAKLSHEEMSRMYHSMKRHEKPGMSEAQLIEACEREWFYRGDAVRDIQARINFLTNYMADFRKYWIRYNYENKYRKQPYKPLADEEMQVVVEALKRHRKSGDTFQDVIDQCVAGWNSEYAQWREQQGQPSDEQIAALVDELFMLILERSPRELETTEYRELTAGYFASLERGPAIQKLMQTVMLNTDFVYRSEFGTGKADEHGRRMMSPRDASYALAYALTDSSPDPELAKAAAAGRLNTRADYEREVRRMLAKRDQYSVIQEAVDQNFSPNFTNMPIRELRFFREFFGYDKLLGIFKDNKRFGGNYESAKERLVSEADMLVEHILELDKDVFNKLLTTEEFYVFHSGDDETMKANSDRLRSIYETFKDKGWEDFTMEDLAKHKDFLAKVKMRGIDPNRLTGAGANKGMLASFKDQMANLTNRFEEGQSATAPYQHKPSHGAADGQNRYGGQMRAVEVAKLFDIDLNNWDYPTSQPAKMPKRKGILTHPAWLISFSGNTQTDPIHKGIWIRKKLLADTIPDVPITVDAVIPEDPHKTLRQRLDEKTNNNYCMRCHDKINPLGLPFEMYDDFGRYRTEEFLEHPENLIKEGPEKPPIEGDSRNTYKSLPVDPRGYLDGTRDSNLDGEVDDALDLIDRLAKSDRVRQSIIRHAFRYFMGRNETLNDSKTLMDADQAYLKSGGSFDELIVSLLTSDSFIYRKPAQTKN